MAEGSGGTGGDGRGVWGHWGRWQRGCCGRSWRSLFSGRLLLLTNTLSCGGLLAAGTEPPAQTPVLPLQGGCSWWAAAWAADAFLYLWLDAAFPARGARCLRTVLRRSWGPAPLGCPGSGEAAVKEKFGSFYKVSPSGVSQLPPVLPGRLERVAGAQILNFLFVPPAYRVFYVNVVTLGWDTYLSYLNTG
uniref:MPV17 mitochondrial inner membrane protein like 2 n=1 Tax=Taeniopygia guttata TaxID=59729 RepID=A0A674HES5_TAEGU